jgi:4-hydroxybenzoate polyprenyltransferase
MMGPWERELFLICLLAAFCGGVAWVLDRELFAATFAAAAVVAGYQVRPR